MDNLNAVPWYRSPVQVAQVTSGVSALIALFPRAGQALGWTTPGDISNGVAAIFGAITVIAPIYGSIKRAASSIQPLTLTQTAADMHPNTLANAQPPTSAPRKGLL
jgi:hypothetical protein